MVLDGLRGYLQLASGLTDVTRERALAAARSLVAQGGAGVDAVVPAPVKSQVATLTEDLLAASRANRTLLLHLVRTEVERSVARLGLVSKAELDAERRRADRLEAKVRELETKVSTAPRRSTATKTAARKTVTRKSTPPTPTAPTQTAPPPTAPPPTAPPPSADPSATTTPPQAGA
jgi:polyhydroxyalkanoate synthesis regulator phasin